MMANRLTTGAAAVVLAHQRQRAEGSDPVGVSSRTKPSKAWAVTMMAGKHSATKRVAGSLPG